MLRIVDPDDRPPAYRVPWRVEHPHPRSVRLQNIGRDYLTHVLAVSLRSGQTLLAHPVSLAPGEVTLIPLPLDWQHESDVALVSWRRGEEEYLYRVAS